VTAAFSFFFSPRTSSCYSGVFVRGARRLLMDFEFGIVNWFCFCWCDSFLFWIVDDFPRSFAGLAAVTRYSGRRFLVVSHERVFSFLVAGGDLAGVEGASHSFVGVSSIVPSFSFFFF